MTGRVFVHSARSDFASTEVLPRLRERHAGQRPAAYTHWGSCGCGAPRLARMHRVGWMRLLPLMRLYRCMSCGAQILRSRTRARLTYGAVYLAPAPLPREPERFQRGAGRTPGGRSFRP